MRDELAGRTVRCKECGASMAVPDEDYGEVTSPSSRKRTKRNSGSRRAKSQTGAVRKQKSTTRRIPTFVKAAIAAGIVGVLAVTALLWFLLGGQEASTESGSLDVAWLPVGTKTIVHVRFAAPWEAFKDELSNNQRYAGEQLEKDFGIGPSTIDSITVAIAEIPEPTTLTEDVDRISVVCGGSTLDDASSAWEWAYENAEVMVLRLKEGYDQSRLMSAIGDPKEKQVAGKTYFSVGDQLFLFHSNSILVVYRSHAILDQCLAQTVPLQLRDSALTNQDDAFSIQVLNLAGATRSVKTMMLEAGCDVLMENDDDNDETKLVFTSDKYAVTSVASIVCPKLGTFDDASHVKNHFVCLSPKDASQLSQSLRTGIQKEIGILKPIEKMLSNFAKLPDASEKDMYEGVTKSIEVLSDLEVRQSGNIVTVVSTREVFLDYVITSDPAKWLLLSPEKKRRLY